ncbi:hypothetical protein GIS00_03075 [Nakamurella sp. YIM 132087]|uniref:DUF3054 family protein n=1 Tax=Nakamurella alba TaxID=2665158 RepID=A0A7K1FFP2_9ACTN|nr:hypothetical protein [Nakamurella alba]MTD12927.1 hypothetical protein [Nakamurella alba]
MTAPFTEQQPEPVVPEPVADVRRGGPADWALVVLVCAVAALTALVSVFQLPQHLGAVPFPVSVLLVGAVLAWAPRACHGLTGSVLGAGAPVIVWFLVTAWLALTRNAMYRAPVSVSDWRMYLLIGVGVLVAAWTLGGLLGRVARPPAAPQV